MTPASPLGLALSRDGAGLYVACAAPLSTICVVDTAKNAIVQRISTGHTTMAPVLSPDGKVLFACNRFQDDVVAIDLITGEAIWRERVRREPIAAAVTPDGKLLLVANHLHSGRSDGGVIGAVVSVLDTANGCTRKQIQLPRGSGMVRDIAISPDGRFAAVTHLVARYYLPPVQVASGGINANALSLLDVNRLEWIRVVYLDRAEQGSANPWAAAWSLDGRNIAVAHAGSHEVSVIEAPNLPQKPVRVRAHIPLPGRGPRALAFSGDRLFVAHYFSDNLSVIDFARLTAPAEALDLGPVPEPSQVRQGEAYFNDARLCYGEWQSCASCHDADGRVDGLNWDLLNDGMGNPKNAKSLLWSHCTPPVMSLGVRTNAEAAVRAGLAYILFTQQPESVAVAIDAYLKSLQPELSPYLAGDKLTDAAARGKTLFLDAKVGCARCHPAPLFTDLKLHQVGTRGVNDPPATGFDTPTLVELWRTGPFLHDGSAATVREVLTTRNIEDLHGQTSHLTHDQVEELAAYLLSL